MVRDEIEWWFSIGGLGGGGEEESCGCMCIELYNMPKANKHATPT